MDFSENSSATLRYVQAIARWCGAKLVLVHVIDPIGYAFPTGMPRSISTDQAASEELNQIEEAAYARDSGSLRRSDRRHY